MRVWIPAVLASLAIAIVTVWAARRTRAAIRRRFRRAAVRAIRQFEVRLERYKLVSRRRVRHDLMGDADVVAAIRAHAVEHQLTEDDVRVRAERYVDEIVPFFDVLSYYRVGYNAARAFLTLLFRVSADYQDAGDIAAIPRNDVVVYLMNHRSNADYVVLAYVLAGNVSISYAVGEWARVWPLEYMFKSFGAYFVRRRYREALYHTILRRYVQLITRNGVTQGIFLEGGLSRDGALRHPKLGLLDYVVGTLRDRSFDRDIWLVPVAINYDRVLEDRTLIAELLDDARPGRVRQCLAVSRFGAFNLVRALTGSLKRYGRVGVTLGRPISTRQWVEGHPGALDAGPETRLHAIREMAEDVMARIAAIVPVTPVPLVCAVLLSFGETAVRRSDLVSRLEESLDHLKHRRARVTHGDSGTGAILDRAWKMLRLRRLVFRDGDAYIILPAQRPLMEYYANSVLHLLPTWEGPPAMHPAADRDETLPRLGPGRGSQ